MNDTITLRRLGLTLRKDFLENGKRYLLLFLAMFGIIAMVHFVNYNSNIYEQGDVYRVNQVANQSLLTSTSFLFLGLGVVFASLLMEPMQSKTKRTSFLMLPSSSLEKYLSRWLIMVVGYILFFFVALWLVDLLRVAVFSIAYPTVDVSMLDFKNLINPSDSYQREYIFSQRNIFYMCLSFFFMSQSILFLGSTFWEKNTFVKTFAAFLGIVLLFFMVARWTILIFYKDVGQFFDMQFFNQSKDSTIAATLTVVFLFFTLLNWVLAYFRFRESEIIKRW